MMKIDRTYLMTVDEFNRLAPGGERFLIVEASGLISKVLKAHEEAGAPGGLFRIEVSFELPVEV